MNRLRIALFCASIGWMAADAQAQMGTYGAPDQIPLGQYQYAPQNPNGPGYAAQYPNVPAVAFRGPYVGAPDGSGPTLSPVPAAAGPGPIGGPGPIPAPPPTMLQPPSESTAVSSMLHEPNAQANPSPGCTMMPQGGYIKEPGNCDTCASGCGEGCTSCCGGCCSPWYFSAEALYMTRSKPNIVYTSAEENSVVHQGYFNDVGWTWGAQTTIGYHFGCCCEWGVEASWWGLAEGQSCGGPGIPGPYVSPMTFGLTDVLGTTGGGGTNGAQTANNYTDNSPNHTTWRNYDAEDVEVNFARTICGGNCSCFDVDFLAGVRWFRFQDGLVWGAERANDGTAYANDWLYLNDHVTNDLIGAQIGFNASYRFCNCWKVFVTPKVGVFDNHITSDYNLYAVSSTNGQVYQGSSQTYTNPNYPVHTTNDGFSFLTQVDLGLDWQATQHISAQVGYRVVSATGIALADSQIPFFGNDTQAIGNIQHEDSLLLHGAFAGLTITW